MNDIVLIPVGSGSTGNSIYLEIGPYRFLLDMGIGYRKIDAALKLHGRDIRDLDAIFVTHGHYDHVRSAQAITRHCDCPVYADKSSFYPLRTVEEGRLRELTDEPLCAFPGLTLTRFSVPHDYVRTFGYTFTCEGRKIAYLTDCGAMDERILGELSGSDVVVLESNHDVEMLKKGPYPLQLQRRILSKYGHLSNKDCADTLYELYQRGTKHFVLAHLSLINNTPEIAERTARERFTDEDFFLYLCPDQGEDLLVF